MATWELKPAYSLSIVEVEQRILQNFNKKRLGGTIYNERI